MSYILDALKRAERERNVTRVPTLTTIHPSALRARRRTGVWLVGGVLLVGAGASLWMSRSSPNVAPPAEMDSRARIGGTPPSSTPGAEPASQPAKPVGAPPPSSVASVPPGQSAGPQREALRPPRPEVPVSPGLIQTSPRRSSEPDGLPVDGGAAKPAEPGPVSGTADSFGEAPGLGQLPPRPQAGTSQSAEQTPGAIVAPPHPSPPANPPGLVDAMAKMTLDVFVYTDAKANRMVVINGRKYVEGQHVEGLYLLEGITPEGAVLTYQGERVVLRP